MTTKARGPKCHDEQGVVVVGSEAWFGTYSDPEQRIRGESLAEASLLGALDSVDALKMMATEGRRLSAFDDRWLHIFGG
jgi:hypothetical protein